MVSYYIIPAIVVPILFFCCGCMYALLKRPAQQSNTNLSYQGHQQAASSQVTVVQTHYALSEPHNTTNYPIQSSQVHQEVYPQPNSCAQPTTGGFAANPIPQQYNDQYPDGVPPLGWTPNPSVPPNVSVIPPYNPEYKPQDDSTIS